MTQEELNKFMTNPDLVGAVIYMINTHIKLPYPHNLRSYFTTGHCNIYAEILTKIFEGYAIPYTNNEHVIVKIGEFFYDVEGPIPNRMVGPDYVEITIDQLYDLPTFGVGNYDKNIDEEIIKTGVQIGKDHIKGLIDAKIEEKKGHSL